eukprot:582165-Amorphochlora_amoeboformis.AAC.1
MQLDCLAIIAGKPDQWTRTTARNRKKRTRMFLGVSKQRRDASSWRVEALVISLWSIAKAIQAVDGARLRSVEVGKIEKNSGKYL